MATEGLRESTAKPHAPVHQEPPRAPKLPRAEEAVQIGGITVVRIASGVAVRAGDTMIKDPRKALALVLEEALKVQAERRKAR